MHRVARLIVVPGAGLLLALGLASGAGADERHATPSPSAATHDHGEHAVVPTPSAEAHDHGTGTTAPAGDDHDDSHDDHGTGTTEPAGGGHDDHGTSVAGTGPEPDTRLLVLSGFAAVNGLVLMVASVQRSRTAGARERRRTARATAPPAV